MIAKYATRRSAEIRAGELARTYGPAVHFHVVDMQGLLFGDTVWCVLGTSTAHGRMFAEYAQDRDLRPEAATATEMPSGVRGVKPH